jgi:ABC-type branched-subunit amino acid transport system substrate-binding protein
MGNKSYLRIPLFLVFLFAFTSARAEIGVTDKEITVGAHTIESGPFAAYAILPKAIDAYFKRLNDAGGVEGRKIKFIREDVGVNYQKALAVTRKLIESDKIFAMVAGQGDPHIAAYKELAAKGVPDLWLIDAASAYEPFPKTAFSYSESFEADGRASADYVLSHYKGKRVCFISGKSLAEDLPRGARAGFEEGNKKSPEKDKVKVGITEMVEKTAPQADAEVARLKADKCDVVIMTLMVPLSANVINYAASQDFKPKWVVFWWNTSAKFLDLVNANVKDGIVSTAIMARASTMEVPGWKDFEDLMKKNDIPVSGTAASGYMIAETFVETLKRAFKMDKNLTRANVVKAAESMAGFKCTICLEPMTVSSQSHWGFLKPSMITVKDGNWVRLKE